MAGQRFERIINGSFKEQSAIVDANVVIEDIDVRSNYGFTLEWDELGFLSAGRSEQNFSATGATSGAVRSQDGTERSTTVATHSSSCWATTCSGWCTRHQQTVTAPGDTCDCMRYVLVPPFVPVPVPPDLYDSTRHELVINRAEHLYWFYWKCR